jgi:protein O-mannosyl-transferase
MKQQNKTNIKGKKATSKKQNLFRKYSSSIWFYPAILFFATLLVYSNSFTVPFHFDDLNQIFYRNDIHSFKLYTNLDFWLSINKRPLSFFTLTLSYLTSGESVFGYHLFNFIVHYLSGIILFFWLKLILSEHRAKPIYDWIPLVASLFFLLHPVQTQSVTYIIQRMTSLSGMFMLLSVFLYTKGRITQISKEKKMFGLLYLGLAVFAGFLSLLSKQNGLVFPLLFLLVELFFIRNKQGKICVKYVAFYSAALFSVFIAGLVLIGIPAETKSITPFQYLATQMTVIPRYVQLIVFPVGLSIDHGIEIAKGFFEAKVLLGTLFLLSLIASAFLLLKRVPLYSFGIGWFFITLLVESSVIPIRDAMFDHRMYLPLAGLGIAIWALLFHYILLRKPVVLKNIVVIVLLLLAIGTFARNNTWQSKEKIWKPVTERYPNHTRGWKALGKAYLDDPAEITNSIRCFERAISLQPDDEDALVDLGFSYMSAREIEKGIIVYQRLAESKKKANKEQALRILAAYYANKNDAPVAANYYKQLLELYPGDNELHKSLCMVFSDAKDYDTAINEVNQWVALEPDEAEAYFVKGRILFNANRRTEAKSQLARAIELNSNHAEAMMLYANTCVNTFDYDEAIEYLERAYSISKNKKIPENIELIKRLKVTSPRPN